MKTKKFLFSIATATVLAGAPVTMTSCDDDDVNTVISLLDLLFTSADQLNGTTWASYGVANGEQYLSMIIAFGNGQVEMYSEDYVDSNGDAILQSGTYTLDTQNNTLTLTLNTGTKVYTVTEFTQNSKLTLTYGGKTITLQPYSGQ
jgi:hypothetical protein